MSERVGTCNSCQGSGEKWHFIPNHPQVVTEVEATESERKELAALQSRPVGSRIIEVSRRFFVRPCAMCEGVAGYSGDAGEIKAI